MSEREQDATKAAYGPMDARRLYDTRNHADATLLVGDKEVNVHKCVLDVVPFFDAAFRNASKMKEGSSGKVSIKMGVPYRSLDVFLRFVYGFPLEECLKGSFSFLFRVIRDCEMLAYRPFMQAAWESLDSCDDYSKEERVQRLELAASHGLEVSVDEQDVEIAPLLSYEAVLYLARLPEDCGATSSAADARFLLVVRWMYANRGTAAEAEAVSKVVTLPARLPTTDLRKLVDYSQEYGVVGSGVVTRLVIAVLATHAGVTFSKPAKPTAESKAPVKRLGASKAAAKRPVPPKAPAKEEVESADESE
jgi:hypothetical protein